MSACEVKQDWRPMNGGVITRLLLHIYNVLYFVQSSTSSKAGSYP